MSKKKKALLVQRGHEWCYQAEVNGSIMTVSTWGSGWNKPGREVGVVDLDMCKIVKFPEDLNDMEVLVEAIKSLDPEYGLCGYDVFMGAEEDDV